MDEKKDGIELLREFSECKKARRACSALVKHYGDADGACNTGRTCAECESGYLAALADRIEREREELDKRLMPEGMEWPPKDCEGEDLHIGEKAHFLRTGYDGDHEWDDVIVAFRHQGVEGEGDAWIVVGEDGEAFACDCAVERPAVLAADGLPIEVGDAVWFADYEKADKGSMMGFGKWSEMKVLDKRPYAVHDIEAKDTGSNLIGFCRAADLTHTPPDTQERIDDNSHLNPIPYARDVLHRDNWDKLTERQAFRLMIDDLMRRKHELDARTMGGAE